MKSKSHPSLSTEPLWLANINVSFFRCPGNVLRHGSCHRRERLTSEAQSGRKQSVSYRNIVHSWGDGSLPCVCSVSVVCLCRWSCSGVKRLWVWRWSRWSELCADCWRQPGWTRSQHLRPSDGQSSVVDPRWYVSVSVVPAGRTKIHVLLYCTSKDNLKILLLLLLFHK